MVLLTMLAVLTLISLKSGRGTLWRDRTTSVDHRRIGAMTVIFAVPTGVKIFNWRFRRHVGRAARHPAGRFRAAQQPLPGGTLPQSRGRQCAVRRVRPLQLLVSEGLRLHADPRLGKALFWHRRVGFHRAFGRLFRLAFMGATRRMQHRANTQWQALKGVAFVGAIVIPCGIGLSVVQLVVSIRTRAHRRGLSGDPWNRRRRD